ncbi:hypothetical protein, partial [Streptomyces thioluteus]|uniref:hypothetical protein n=1 Tax=Streptomyces thioluteus TaxID=66431 RepID=UPI0031E7673B
MNQSPYTARRRNIVNASSGYPDRMQVVLYALIHDGGSSPNMVLDRLRRHAEARDWVVHSAFFDIAGLTSARAERHS